MVAVALVLLTAGAGLLWPYQAESIEGVVAGNRTGCSIDVTSNGGWHDEVIAPGITASRVTYPLKVNAFISDCPGILDGQPYSAELVSMRSGELVARGTSCADRFEGDPCRLEMPPIAALPGEDRYRISVVRRAGHMPLTADINLRLKREWRSVVWDALMSV